MATIILGGDVQHSTDQQKFGATSIKFDGAGDYLYTNNWDYLIFWASTEWTVESFVYFPSGITSEHGIWYNHRDSQNWFNCWYNASTNILHAKYLYSNSEQFDLIGGALTYDTWHHIAIVKNGTSYTLYVDGISKDSGTSAGSGWTDWKDFSWGRNFTSTDIRYMIGYQEEIRISRRAIYTSNFTPPTVPFVRWPDKNTLILIQSDHTNGSTNISESPEVLPDLPLLSPSNTNVVHSTNRAKFGSTSIYLATNWIYIPPDDRFNTIGSGDFTLECFLNNTDWGSSPSGSGTYTLMSIGNPEYSQGARFRFNSINNRIILRVTTHEAAFGSAWGNWPPQSNTWLHLAMVRESGYVRFYYNGVRVIDGFQAADSLDNITDWGWFGEIAGYMDEIRISNIARYTGSSITVPTGQFTKDDNTLLLVHSDTFNGDTNFVDSATPSPYIDITNPSAGVLIKNHLYNIEWTSENISGNVDIYETYNGIDWNPVATNTPNDGTEPWIPTQATLDGQIRIDVPNTRDSFYSDTLQIFDPSIATINISSPNASSVVAVGVPFDIRWDYSEIIGNVTIDLSIDDGAFTTIKNATPVTNQQWEWIPAIEHLTTNARIKIRGLEGLVYDISPSFPIIEVTPSITITSPESGDEYTGDSSQTFYITWISEFLTGNVTIRYTLNNGVSWIDLATVDIATGSYSWTPGSDKISDQVKIEVIHTETGTNDITDTFRIIDPYLYLTNPIGGMILEPGPITITWDGNLDDTPNTITIEYSDDDGITWNEIVSDFDFDTKSYPWTVSNTTGTLLRILADDGSEVYTTPNGYYVPTTGNIINKIGTITIAFVNSRVQFYNMAIEYDVSTLNESIPAETPRYIEIRLEKSNGQLIFTDNVDVANTLHIGTIRRMASSWFEDVLNNSSKLDNIAPGNYNIIYRIWSENPHLLDQWIVSLNISFTPALLKNYTFSGDLGVYDMTYTIWPKITPHIDQTMTIITPEANFKLSCWNETEQPVIINNP